MSEINWEVSDLDGVPESIRDSYTKTDGGTYRLAGLKLPNGQKVENLPALLSAHESIRSEKSDVERKLKSVGEKLSAYVDEDGNQLDADEVRAVLARVRSGKVKDSGEVEKAVDAARKQAAEEFSGKLKALSEKADRYQEQLRSDKLDREAMVAASKTTCPPTVAARLVRDFADVVESDDGTFQVVIRNAEGAPRLSTREESAGDPMTVAEFVQDILPQEYPDFFPRRATGGGPSGKSTATTSDKFKGLSGAGLVRAAMANKANQGR